MLLGGSMSRSTRDLGPSQRPQPRTQLREILLDLARWAVTSSLGLTAACSGYHDGGLGQPVPTPNSGADGASDGTGTTGSGARPTTPTATGFGSGTTSGAAGKPM